MDRKKAVKENYLSVSGGEFWQYFLKQLREKKEYYLHNLMAAHSWDEALKAQGALNALQNVDSIISDIEKIKLD